MARRRTCVLFLACGLFFSSTFFFLLGTKAWQNHRYVSFQPGLNMRTPTKAVSSENRANSLRTHETPAVNIATSQVELIRRWITSFFNLDTDLTVIKSQVQIGQTIQYEASRNKSTNITENFFRLIPESSPLLGRHFRSCAVVGNSGILLGSRCGPQIDSADFVFRCNLPAIEGFEEDVGTKANFTTMNPSVLPHDYDGYINTTSVQDRFVKRLRLLHDQILHIPAFVTVNGREHVEFANRMILEHHLPMKLSYAPSDANKKMKMLWGSSEFHTKRPSTGNILYVLATCLCDQVHLYGFYPFDKDEKGRDIKYHYFGELKNSTRNHNMTEEYRAFQRLHQRKALVLHTEPCDNVKL
ncbi:PREDICTED: CMP-N-acetylneuraminate-poly-alpha-2,8-sialyltransferase-like isoform X1 [Branchiostoma belcheri]|uniref:CMP-N-acetylneuraminate-poly-alpha-2, 8-sialyltransferase-like isoform X1 n=1 Tax=Branchiostoma belcheri TaxID=7741 RepID=A0A6P4Y4P5_BRABE|nr:PREDICTED: CMP-N-acetylneuraminate-poly-alpha-2,8-sialyltransferase-like isoform X1 [Branchiostoma belcheri]